MIRIFLAGCAIVLIAGAARGEETADAGQTFDDRVAPVLIRRCLGCHSGGDPKGGLDLSRKAAAMAGGESGLVLVPGQPDESLLWQRVRDEEMPPEHPLAAAEKKVLADWIAGGAAWGTDPIDPFRFTTEQRAGYDWWALQSVTRPAPPEVQNRAWPRNAIDEFILAKLENSGLAPSSEAGKRTLIRRLSFDLLGLPPSPEDVANFVTDDRPDAYQRLVDRLLASPHYGVRIGRAWLDLARFGESQGFERDKLRENAWPYRDWVIEAFNSDLPYDDFVRLQIAGDVLHPGDASAITATGFLVAGAYDEVGQQQQSAAMKAVVRQDELEDLTSVVGESFLGLTVHCARCHDHKFDPIRQREYYQLAAALDGVHHGERQVDTPENAREREQTSRELEIARNELGELERSARSRIREDNHRALETAGPTPIAKWSFDDDLRDEVGSLHATLQGGAWLSEGALIADGKNAFASTAPLAKNLRAKTLEAWVRLDNLEQAGGGVIGVQTLDGAVFDAIVFGEREPGRWMAGSDFFRRTHPLEGPAETEANERVVHVAAVYHEDGAIAIYRDGQPYGKPYKSSGPVTFEAGKSQIVFGLRHGPPGGNRMLAGAVDAAQLYDRALSDAEIAASAAAGDSVTQERLIAAMTPDEKRRREVLQGRSAELAASLESVQPQTVYAVTPATPDTSHVLLRGNPAAKGDEVAPGGIESLVGVEANFGLAADAPDVARREKLAAWITDPHNPLTARVMVNRLWRHHFGAGLVDTPSDFGFNGARPSHAGLLDYLAAEFVDSGWSVKRMQRMIVMSAAYRQSSKAESRKPKAEKENVPLSAFRFPLSVDSGNRLLWRKSPRRLEAEELRDAILWCAGELNSELGGPGFRDFTTYVHNTQFYEMLDPIGPEFNRRSVYRTWIRSGRSRFLDAFDCPDPSTKTPKRAVTTTPLQALSLLNNSFVLRMSDRMADRLQRDAGDDVTKQIDRAFQLAYGRGPSHDETAAIEPFIREHGLAEFCRVLLNSNEFLYVE